MPTATVPKKTVLARGSVSQVARAEALLGLLIEDTRGAHIRVDGQVAIHSAALRSVLVPLLLPPQSGLPTPVPGGGGDPVQGESTLALGR